MSALDRIADACLRHAARRWSPGMSDELLREWRAELEMVRRDDLVNAATRAWRQISYAASLALCRPESPAAGAWKSRIGGAGQRAAAFLVLAVAAIVVAPSVLQSAVSHVHHAGVDVAVLVAVEVLLSGLMAWIGLRVARPAPGSSAFGLAASSLVPIALALAAVFAGSSGFEGLTFLSDGAIGRRALIGVVIWSAVMLPTLALMVRNSRAGRRAAAICFAVAGAAIALELAPIGVVYAEARADGVPLTTAPIWFPSSLLPYDTLVYGRHYSDGVHQIGSSTISGPGFYASALIHPIVLAAALPLLMCSAFVIANVIRRSRMATVSATPAPAPRQRLVPVAPAWTRAIAALLGVSGVAVWVYVSALAVMRTPSTGDWTNGQPTDVRLAAVALVVLALIPFLAGRGPVTPGALAVAVALTVTDSIVSWRSAHGAVVAIVIVAVAIIAIAAAWLMTPRLAGPNTTDGSARRALLASAVTAPLLILTDVMFGTVVPGSVMAATYVLDAALWTLAVVSALASRRSPLSPVATGLMWTLPLAAVLYAVPSSHLKGLYGPSASLAVQLAAAVIAFAVAWWDRPRRRLLAATAVGGSALAVFLLSMAIEDALRGVSVIGGVLLSGWGQAGPIVATPEFGGPILLGLTAGVFLARRAVPDGPDGQAPSGLAPAPRPA